jgi:GNAT superfamily N-acetyltransferase
MAKIEIREFSQEDAAELHSIREAAFVPVFESFRTIVGPAIAGPAFAKAEEEQAKLLDNLCDPESDGKVFVVLRSGAIVGFYSVLLNVEQRIGEIGLNAVHPVHAGQGIGTEMYRHALDYMKQAGMEVATVGTGGDPSHAPARRAYEKVGFGPAVPSVYLYRKL